MNINNSSQSIDNMHNKHNDIYYQLTCKDKCNARRRKAFKDIKSKLSIDENRMYTQLEHWLWKQKTCQLHELIAEETLIHFFPI